MEQRYNSPSGRIALLLRLDKCRYLRSFLLPILGIFVLCALGIWIGLPMLHADSTSEFLSAPSIDGYFLWNILWFVLTIGVIGAYFNRSVQHSGAVAFSVLPASLREKSVAMLIFSLAIFGAFLLVQALASLVIYGIRSEDFLNLEIALDNFGDMVSDLYRTLRIRMDRDLSLWRDAELWAKLCMYAFSASFIALLFRLAIAWRSYVKAVFLTAVCTLAGIIMMASTSVWLVRSREMVEGMIAGPARFFLLLWVVLAIFHIRGMYKLLQRTDL